MIRNLPIKSSIEPISYFGIIIIITDMITNLCEWLEMILLQLVENQKILGSEIYI